MSLMMAVFLTKVTYGNLAVQVSLLYVVGTAYWSLYASGALQLRALWYGPPEGPYWDGTCQNRSHSTERYTHCKTTWPFVVSSLRKTDIGVVPLELHL